MPTNIRDHVKQELRKYNGVMMPKKANLIEQIFIRKVSPAKLHPNPSDEFCMDSVGPNDEIISKYQKQILHNHKFNLEIFDEPLMVEKMKPNGFLLLNGHHRWAAALMLDEKKVPVRVINTTNIEDIIEALQKSTRDKRVSINLDDVVYCKDPSEPSEKPLFFPLSLLFRKRIRKGIPELFFNLQNDGYDIWVYTYSYESTDYLKRLFRYHQIHVNGIINGAQRLSLWKTNDPNNAAELIAKKYRVTMNIDLNSVSWIRSSTKEFDIIEVKDKGENWAKEVISIVRNLKDL